MEKLYTAPGMAPVSTGKGTNAFTPSHSIDCLKVPSWVLPFQLPPSALFNTAVAERIVMFDFDPCALRGGPCRFHPE